MIIEKLIKTNIYCNDSKHQLPNFSENTAQMKSVKTSFFSAPKVWPIQIFIGKTCLTNVRIVEVFLIKWQILFNTTELILTKSPIIINTNYFIAQPFLDTTDTMTLINTIYLKNVAKLLIKDHHLLSIREFIMWRSPANVAT